MEMRNLEPKGDMVVFQIGDPAQQVVTCTMSASAARGIAEKLRRAADEADRTAEK